MMFLFKVLAVAFAVALVFSNAESRYLHPRIKGTMIEKSFDEATGKIGIVLFALVLRRRNSRNKII